MHANILLAFLNKCGHLLRQHVGFLLGCALSIVIGSLVGSVLCQDWSWFQRSGSVLALTGALDLPATASSHKLAALLVPIGTVIWGYGDLLGGVL